MGVSVAEMDGEGEEVPLWFLIKVLRKRGLLSTYHYWSEARVVTVSWHGTAWLSIILQ